MHFVTRSAYACVRINSRSNYMRRRGGTYDNMMNRLQNASSKVTTPSRMKCTLCVRKPRTCTDWNDDIFQRTVYGKEKQKTLGIRFLQTRTRSNSQIGTYTTGWCERQNERGCCMGWWILWPYIERTCECIQQRTNGEDTRSALHARGFFQLFWLTSSGPARFLHVVKWRW